MKKYQLIKSFALFSFIAFSLTGIVISSLVSTHIRKDKLDILEEAVKVIIHSIARDNLTVSDFKNLIQDNKAKQIKLDINQSLYIYGLQSITLINDDKKIIMSDKLDTANSPIDNDVLIDNILKAKTLSEISEVYKIERPGDKPVSESFFNIYEPVEFDGKVKGVFVLQIPDQTIASHVNMLIQDVALTLSGGLLVLFLLMIGHLYGTTKTLINQNDDLARKKVDLEQSYKKLDDTYKSTVLALSSAVDARDPYTSGHSGRVAEISLLISKEMNMSERDTRILEYAAMFHDIGKLGIPDTILLKNGKLTDDEYNVIKRHPNIGVGILEKIGFLAEALPIIRHHHERFSGNGYPDGIRGDEIPLGSRIIAIADTYDAITTDRPYRRKLNHNSAIQEIQKNKGTQFDDKLVDVFMRIVHLINI